MKLYEVPNHTWVRLMSDEEGPVSSLKPKVMGVYMFNHVDGMYSHCRDPQGNVMHLPAWSEVKILENNKNKEEPTCQEDAKPAT